MRARSGCVTCCNVLRSPTSMCLMEEYDGKRRTRKRVRRPISCGFSRASSSMAEAVGAVFGRYCARTANKGKRRRTWEEGGRWCGATCMSWRIP